MQHRVPVSSAPRYSAISYFSGSPRETAEINIDGVAFRAFSNLHIALQNLISF
ncbi:hypothetical protein F4678DRAFT_237561 [Xylaria arbuscula]|nr:hypothetical protein F4678DRAFT_237561 [Xylaria arbuscula]